MEGCNGALAGMVAICASADAIDLWAAWVLGALGAVAFKLLGSLVHRCGIDDVCDAVGLHLGGGITGVRTPSQPPPPPPPQTASPLLSCFFLPWRIIIFAILFWRCFRPTVDWLPTT